MLALPLTAGLLSAACVIQDTTENTVSDCKDSCDKLKFFDCADAQTHAACFTSCESASASAREKFVACVDNDICDPECLANLNDAAAGGSETGPSQSTEGGVVGGTTTCFDACSDFAADGCAPGIDCSSQCGMLSDAQQQQAIACLDARDGCELPPECGSYFEVTEETTGAADSTTGGPGGNVLQCESACDTALFNECIDALQQSMCHSVCQTASQASIEIFDTCVLTCQDDLCYGAFVDAQ